MSISKNYKIIADHHLKSGDKISEELLKVFVEDTEEPTGQGVLIVVRTLNKEEMEKRQMARPASSNQACSCCGRPK